MKSSDIKKFIIDYNIIIIVALFLIIDIFIPFECYMRHPIKHPFSMNLEYNLYFFNLKHNIERIILGIVFLINLIIRINRFIKKKKAI